MTNVLLNINSYGGSVEYLLPQNINSYSNPVERIYAKK